jgi:hypothetical protein
MQERTLPDGTQPPANVEEKQESQSVTSPPDEMTMVLRDSPAPVKNRPNTKRETMRTPAGDTRRDETIHDDHQTSQPSTASPRSLETVFQPPDSARKNRAIINPNGGTIYSADPTIGPEEAQTFDQHNPDAVLLAW